MKPAAKRRRPVAVMAIRKLIPAGHIFLGQGGNFVPTKTSFKGAYYWHDGNKWQMLESSSCGGREKTHYYSAVAESPVLALNGWSNSTPKPTVEKHVRGPRGPYGPRKPKFALPGIEPKRAAETPQAEDISVPLKPLGNNGTEPFLVVGRRYLMANGMEVRIICTDKQCDAIIGGYTCVGLVQHKGHEQLRSFTKDGYNVSPAKPTQYDIVSEVSDFDWLIIPLWHDYIAKDKDGTWHSHGTKPGMLHDNRWYSGALDNIRIPDEFCPKTPVAWQESVRCRPSIQSITE